MLDAARALFEEIGYEAATIRAIAQRAGVSVGSVFTTFRSKGHILSHVMQDRLTALYLELERVLPHVRGSAADRCRSLFAVHYDFEMRRVRLFLAYLAGSYVDSSITTFGSVSGLRNMVRECIQGGVERGEVRRDADIDLAIDLLLACYSWNYRLVAIDDADASQLTGLMDRQIGVIFEGLRP